MAFKGLKRYPMRKGASLPAEMQVKVALPTPETAVEMEEHAKLFRDIFGLM